MNADQSSANEKNQRILVQMEIDQHLLKCQICLGYVEFPILQCSVGPHYICGECVGKVRKCEICKTGRFFQNRLLGEQLLPHCTTCCIPGCGKVCLPWTKGSHILACRYRPQSCFFCGVLVSQGKLEHHLSEDCSCVYTKVEVSNSALHSMGEFNCSRTERSTFALPLPSQEGRSICAKSGNFYIFCKTAKISTATNASRCWLVTAYHNIPTSYIANGEDPSVEFEVMDNTGCFPSSLSMMLQPFDNLKDISETLAGIIPVISCDMEIRCTIRQDNRNCKVWMSPISGTHHDHEVEDQTISYFGAGAAADNV